MAAAIALALAPLPVTALAETIEGAVTRVIDGDTFHFAATSIRLCGIDAPERGEPGYGEAAGALEDLTRGRTVRCIPVGAGTPCDGRSRRTSRGRIVAQCFVGSEDLAVALVRAGHACDWPEFSGGAYSSGNASARCPR